MKDIAVVVGQHLHLNVARRGHEALQKESVVAERRRSDAAGRQESVGEVVGALHDLHSLAAAAGGRLDQQRIPHLGRGPDEFFVAEPRARDSRNNRHTEAGDMVLRADLIAHHGQRVDARPDKDNAGVSAGLREG